MCTEQKSQAFSDGTRDSLLILTSSISSEAGASLRFDDQQSFAAARSLAEASISWTHLVLDLGLLKMGTTLYTVLTAKMLFLRDQVRKYRGEATLLLLLGSLLLLLAPAKIHLGLLSPIQNAYLWRRSGVVEGLLATYGLLFIVLAFWSRKTSAGGVFLTERILRYARDAFALVRDDLLPSMRRCLISRQNVAWLFLVVGVGVALRGYFLAQPMRYDEAYTFFNYINGDITRAFNYPIPNNHVLHTILAKLSTLIWGTHPESIRFPAFLAGTASIPLMFCLCRRLLSGRSGLLASIAVAVSPYLVLYSTNARGYSLVVFLSLALALIGVHFTKAPSVPASALMSAIAALGLLTVPSMAFPVSGIYLWLFCVYLLNGNSLWRVVREFVLPCVLITIGLATFFYSPVVFVTNGVRSLLSNEFVQSQASDVFLSQVYPHVAETFADFTRDIPVVILVSCALLVALGTYSAARQRNWAIVLMLPSLLAASAALFMIKHAIPYPRTWIFFIPFVFLVADAGWTYCVENCPKLVQKAAIQGMIAAGLFYALSLISSNAIAKYHDTGNFPEAPVVASFLESAMEENDAVDGIVPVDYTTYFYLWYRNKGDIRPRRDHPSPNKFYVVKKSNYAIEDTTEDDVVKVFEMGDVEVYKSIAQEVERSELEPSPNRSGKAKSECQESELGNFCTEDSVSGDGSK
jgi:hypothetical protein